MDNRLALTLAVGAGYLLGRTKKAKLALGVGGMVLGKRLKLTPQQLGGLLTEQLKNNPQLAEVRDQLRGDLQGVGKAAATALVSRRLDALSDRLHDSTLGVKDKLGGLSGAVPGAPSRGGRDGTADHDERDDDGRDERGEREQDRGDEEKPAPRKTAQKRSSGAGASSKEAGGSRESAKSRGSASGATKKTAGSGRSGRPVKKTAASADSRGRTAGSAAKKTAARRRTGGEDRG
ncbi:DNA primase [Streptomyces zingiberis]|uniref:DNA primase n=1 Tax=Streptomyces zingiberis TaxID=2053010 RepID=A0ABX1BUD9_9ACTN|nr:DNA primase [Streptomyces zingiberis]NJQ01336.1 DNA primase [Streptomyces zingiberis]